VSGEKKGSDGYRRSRFTSRSEPDRNMSKGIRTVAGSGIAVSGEMSSIMMPLPLVPT